MKTYRLLILGLIVCSMGFTACVDTFKAGDNFLEKQPGVDVSIDTVFGKAEYARDFLWNTYSGLYYGLTWGWDAIGKKMNMEMFECLSDCWHSHLGWGGASRDYYSGTYSAGLENGSDQDRFSYLREGVWETVRKGWIFIENVDRVPDMSDSEKKQLKAEAKVIIATRYFDMYRHYGGLPLVTHAYTATEEFSNPRATVEATTNFMINLLDEAAADLPWAVPSADMDNWDGRMTKAGAMGLKCKILLFAASPLFNDAVPYSTLPPQDAVDKRQVWYGGYKPELWTQCKTACEDFFTALAANGRYGLVMATGTSPKDYRQAFRNAYLSRGNSEILIGTRLGGVYVAGSWWNHCFRTVTCPGGALTPTQEYVEMFPMADGTPFDWNNPTDVSEMFTSRDPRLYETILVDGADFQGRQAEMWVGGREAQKDAATEASGRQYSTGYGNFKFILDYNQSSSTPTVWPYLRMSELYLTYAEALLNADNNFMGAIAQIDIVRARVGLKGLVACNPGKNLTTDKKALMEEILRERACELGLEDVRLFDMCRNKRADLFSRRLHGLRMYRADKKEESWSDHPNGQPRPTAFTYEKFPLTNPSRAWWTSFDSKWYLSAFPPNEVNKDYGLTQNPGW